MKNQKFLWKKLICYLGLITILNSPVCVKASDVSMEEAKWFPVSVASIKDRKEILVNHNYKYEKRLIKIRNGFYLCCRMQDLICRKKHIRGI